MPADDPFLGHYDVHYQPPALPAPSDLGLWLEIVGADRMEALCEYVPMSRVEHIEANGPPDDRIYIVAVRDIRNVEQWVTRTPPRVIAGSQLAAAMGGGYAPEEMPVLPQPMEPGKGGTEHDRFVAGWNAYRNCTLKLWHQKREVGG